MCTRLCLPVVLLVLSLGASRSYAREGAPQAGYVYPAGGQRGTTFSAIVGGMSLKGADAVWFSGQGIQARVVEHVRPLNQGAFKELQNEMGILRKKKKDAGIDTTRGRRGRQSSASTNANWTADDERKLREMRERLSTFAVRRFSVPGLVETVTLEVMIEADARIGDREIRLHTANGLTNPLVFCVDQLPEITERSARDDALEASGKRGQRGRKKQAASRPDPGTTPPDKKPETETRVSVPVTLNGQIVPGDVDRYRFRARKGQQIVAAVSARKLIPYLADAVPGWFQATVALYDTGGREIAYCDDFKFHPDPVMCCRIPEDGDYVLEIKDAIYRGREDFVYRIALGEIPYITEIFPLGTRAGHAADVQVRGWNLPVRTLRASPEETGVRPIALQSGAYLSNAVLFAADDLPESLEAEPNNATDNANPVTIRSIVNGRIDQPGDRDTYALSCDAGKEIVCEIVARRLGSPLDAMLTLTTPDGRRLAYNDDCVDKGAGLVTHHADSRIVARISRKAVYYLTVSDTQRRGGADFAYRLHIRERTPDFELRLVPPSINGRPGMTVPFTIHALRRDGFEGPIAVELLDAPAGFHIDGGSIPKGHDGIRATLSIPQKPPRPYSRLSIIGKATIDGRTVVKQAVAAEDRMQAFLWRHLLPANGMMVGIREGASRDPMKVMTRAPVLLQPGSRSRIQIQVPKRGFFGRLEAELSDPPEGISIASFQPGKRNGEIALAYNPQTPQAGLQGNLIVNIYTAKSGAPSTKGKEQRKVRRALLGALPAIPFAVAGEMK